MRNILIIFTMLSLLVGCKKESEWIRQKSPVTDDIHYAFFLDDKLGWAITYGTGILLRTSNAGESWEEIKRFDSSFYERIHFTDWQTGWLCGANNTILKTEDGGITWEVRSIAIEGYRYYLYSMYFRNRDEGYIGGIKVDMARDMTNVVLHTVNGGKSWLKYENEPPVFAMDILYTTEYQGFVCGDNKIYTTSDGGKTWSIVYSEDPFREGFRDLHFYDQRQGFAVNSKGDVIRSSDSGQTWSKQSISNNRLRSIAFISEKEGYCAGDVSPETGNFFHTVNGGDTWEMVTDTLPDIHCLVNTRKYIYAFGKEGMILRKRI